MFYDFEIEAHEDGRVYILCDVFGRIPVPPELSEKVLQTDKEFRDMVCKVHAAISEGDTQGGAEIVDEMERRWGAMQTQVRSLRWQVLEDSVGEE